MLLGTLLFEVTGCSCDLRTDRKPAHANGFKEWEAAYRIENQVEIEW